MGGESLYPLAVVRAAYMAGFAASGEGYNGEYPFGDGDLAQIDNALDGAFTEWVATKPTSGPT